MAPLRRSLLQGIENHLRVLGCDVHTRIVLDLQIPRLMMLLDGATDDQLSGMLSAVYRARDWEEAVELVSGQ